MKMKNIINFDAEKYKNKEYKTRRGNIQSW